MSLGYRLRQGLGRIGAWLCPRRLDLALARRLLPAELWAPFASMPPGDQWHGLCVARRLLAEGWQQTDLLAAALLHDCGKAGSGLTLAHRTAIILANALRTDWVARLAVARPESWRYPFYVQRQHAALGAERLRAAGASDAVVQLVATHERESAQSTPELAAWQRALIAADNAC